MSYYIDLKTISLDKFKSKLKNANLLPSQKILLEKIDERFAYFKNNNINNLFELQEVLKTKSNVQAFSKTSKLPEKYLIVLRREVNSYHPQARKIKDFPCIDEKLKKQLENMSIKTTVELFDYVATKEKRNKLKKELNITNGEILLLTRLTDVSRLRYVNQTFATLLINTRYDTVAKIQKANYKALYDELLKINKQNKFFKGNINLKDMEFFVEDSKIPPLEIKY